MKSIGVLSIKAIRCVVFLIQRFILSALPLYVLQVMFQTFFVTAQKTQLGLAATIVSGVTNMILDALLIAVFRLGIHGAALATAMSQAIGGIIPLVYFFRKNDSLLQLSKTNFKIRRR